MQCGRAGIMASFMVSGTGVFPMLMDVAQLSEIWTEWPISILYSVVNHFGGNWQIRRSPISIKSGLITVSDARWAVEVLSQDHMISAV
jgi:hypothetical protein